MYMLWRKVCSKDINVILAFSFCRCGRPNVYLCIRIYEYRVPLLSFLTIFLKISQLSPLYLYTLDNWIMPYFGRLSFGWMKAVNDLLRRWKRGMAKLTLITIGAQTAPCPHCCTPFLWSLLLILKVVSIGKYYYQARYLSFRDASSEWRIVRGTYRSLDASSKGWIVRGSHHPLGRIVWGTHRPRNASSKDRVVQEQTVGDASGSGTD